MASALALQCCTIWAMKALHWEQANLLSSSLPWKEWNMKKIWAADTEKQILNEDMIVAAVIAITTCWSLQVGRFLETARSRRR